MHEHWELRFNAYFPEDNKTGELDADVVGNAATEEIYVLASQGRNLDGFDGEIGARIARIDKVDFGAGNFLTGSSVDI